MASASLKSRNSLKLRRSVSRRLWLTWRVAAWRILFDKNVPAGLRFLVSHEVFTVVEMRWPDQLENGELLTAAAHVYRRCNSTIRFTAVFDPGNLNCGRALVIEEHPVVATA